MIERRGGFARYSWQVVLTSSASESSSFYELRNYESDRCFDSYNDWIELCSEAGRFCSGFISSYSSLEFSSGLGICSSSTFSPAFFRLISSVVYIAILVKTFLLAWFKASHFYWISLPLICLFCFLISLTWYFVKKVNPVKAIRGGFFR